MTKIVPTDEVLRPSLTVAALKFSDGTSIALEENDLVLLVGPNNSGKSMALRQIETILGDNGRYNIISGLKARVIGNDRSFYEELISVSQEIYHYSRRQYVGYKYSIDTDRVPSLTDSRTDAVRDFFVLRCATDARLSDSAPVKAIAYRREPPVHPIHLLVMNRTLEQKIDQIFFTAFNRHLYVNRADGAEVGLFVGDRARESLPDDDFSTDSVEFFRNEASPLNQQGDGMRSFATVALNTLAISQQSVLLIDEPEAFLHPPQARLIGRVIATNGNRKRQRFIATHSSDVLKGVVESGSTVKLLRITRCGDINNIKLLDPEHTKELFSDPLIRHSGIMDGVFYRHVIICEADTDCQFYSTIMGLSAVSGSVEPDVLFVQGSGKHRINKLANVALQLGVPASIIADIDILNDKALFKKTAETVGLSWTEIEPLWKSVYDAISSQKVRLSIAQLITSIDEVVTQLKAGKLSPMESLAEIRDRIRANSPWESVKKAGRAFLPMGDVVQKFDKLLQVCGKHGLWIVPVGELEGFCRTIKSHKGSQWIIELLETKNLDESDELSDARSFVKDIWARIDAT